MYSIGWLSCKSMTKQNNSFLVQLFLDDEANGVVSNTVSVNYFPGNIAQTAKSVKSKKGWVWIGGIQGRSQDAFHAMDEAMSILKCRYAVV